MGLAGIVISFGPAIGPTLSGWLLEHFSWCSLFYVVLPINILTIIFAYFAMKNVIKHTHPKIDVLSIVLSSLGFGGGLFGFSSVGKDGWTSAKVLISLIAGSVILALFQGLTQQEAKIQIAHQAQLSGYNASFLFATLVATAGVIISLFLKNKSASK